MPDQPPPEKIPTVEEIEKELGMDAMSMFHDMVTPDTPEERAEHGENI
jgi:hypothetical protein